MMIAPGPDHPSWQSKSLSARYELRTPFLHAPDWVGIDSARGRPLFNRVPTRRRSDRGHLLCQFCSVGSEIFLVYGIVLGNDERHHARRTVFRGVGDEGECGIGAATLRLSTLALSTQHSEVVSVEWT